MSRKTLGRHRSRFGSIRRKSGGRDSIISKQGRRRLMATTPTDSSGEIRAAAIREQLERVLADPLFRKSKRYPAFLRHVTEAGLKGEAEKLREKAIGTAVFDRHAEYDSDADPIVRVTAGEIRKRLAEYYRQPQHAGEIQIQLPAGSYAPHFLPASGLDNQKD